MSANPWSESITLGSSGTAVNLFAAIQALDVTVKYPQCCKIQIQLDPGAGGAKLFGGNSDVSSTNHGWEIVAGQIKNWEALQQNLYNLQQIWLVSDTSEVKVNVEFVIH